MKLLLAFMRAARRSINKCGRLVNRAVERLDNDTSIESLNECGRKDDRLILRSFVALHEDAVTFSACGKTMD